MSTYSIFIALIIVVCLLLVLVVMVQNPKGGGLSSSFGGGGQQLGGVQKTSDFLDRSTWVLAGLLIALILLSNIALDTNNKVTDSKLLEDTTTPVIPETLPESTPDTSQETIPEIPEVPVDNN
ncbi:MAG: preprotein translocase subunit SecG [Flavobacteriaceae bacterium]